MHAGGADDGGGAGEDAGGWHCVRATAWGGCGSHAPSTTHSRVRMAFRSESSGVGSGGGGRGGDAGLPLRDFRVGDLGDCKIAKLQNFKLAIFGK